MLGAGSMPDEFFKPQADLHKICLQFFLFKRQGLRIIRLIQPQAFFRVCSREWQNSWIR